MKKSKLINSEISYTISKMGHIDTLTIGDCGLPIPKGVNRIDLALTHGIPTFLETLDTVLEELCVEEITIASEMKEKNIGIYNEILNRFVPIRAIPKLDYSKGIPKESRTMVVIPTIVSNTEKVKEMFDILETFYIINKSDNLYFTLLGDAKTSDKEKEDYDEEIKEYGVEYAKKLNEKYKKDIFYFIYRKRIWHEGENAFLGYERKRGALLQFNKILFIQFYNMFFIFICYVI